MLCNKCSKAFDDANVCPFCGTKVIKFGLGKSNESEAGDEELKNVNPFKKTVEASEEEEKMTVEAEDKKEPKAEEQKDAKADKAEAPEDKAEEQKKAEAEDKKEPEAGEKKTAEAEDKKESEAEEQNETETETNDADASEDKAEEQKNEADDEAEEFTPVLGAFVPTGVQPKPSVPVEEIANPVMNTTEAPKKSKAVLFIVIAAVAVVLIVAGCFGAFFVLKNGKYNKAMDIFNNSDYSTSYELFTALGTYKDSEFWAKYSKSEQDMQTIESLEAAHEFDAIINILTTRAELLGSDEKGIEAMKLSNEYDVVKRAFSNKESKEYGMAKAEFDSLVLLKEKYAEQICLCEALDCMLDEWWEDAIANLYAIQIGDYDFSFLDDPKNEDEEIIASFYYDDYIDYDKVDKIAEILKPANEDQQEVYDIVITNLKYDKATYLVNEENYEAAMKIFEELGDFADSAERYAECNDKIAGVMEQYELAQTYYDNGEYYSAKKAWESCADYKDSKEKAASCVQTMPGNNSMKTDPDGISPLYLYAPQDYSMLFRVYKNGDLVAQVFVAAGDNATLNLNDGTYSMKVAFGTEWYGEKEMFGENGVYNKILNDGSEDIPMAFPYYLKIDYSSGLKAVLGVGIPEGAAGM